MSQIQQVKDASDIVSVIGERVSLQRSGASLKANCPFHSETTPSFFVSEQIQRYKCFGCGESGDVFTFLEKYEGMTFGEALKYLAERAGITLTEYKPTREDDEREQIATVLDQAKEYYHFLLTKHESGVAGREYLKSRGINSASIKLFKMGLSLPVWDGLVTYLTKKKKVSPELLIKAGLAVQGKNNSLYDRFRGRLMFPLKNHRGQVVGFSGRLLEKDAKEAKYINTPETLVYHKSKMLFGFSELYQEIRKAGEVIVVEGEFDVISSQQAHVNNVVAVKGSAFTADHAKLIGRVATKVLLSLDMDSAGVEATKRAVEVLRPTGLELRVILISSGKDPDDLARTAPDEWRKAVKESISVYEFFIRSTTAKYDVQTPEGKRDVINELAPILSQIPHAVEKDYYLKRLAAVLEVKPEFVKDDIQKFGAVGRRVGQRTAANLPAAQPQSQELSRRQKLEQYLLFLLFHTSVLPAHLVPQIHQLSFQQSQLNSLKQAVLTQGEAARHQALQTLAADQSQVLMDIVASPDFVKPASDNDLEQEVTAVLQELHKAVAKDRVEQITAELDHLDEIDTKSPEQELRQAELLAEIVRLRTQL